MRIIKASHNFPDMIPVLKSLLPHDEVTAVGEEELAAACAGAQVLIPTMARVPGEVIAGSSLRLIQQFGVGLEGVDIPAATAAGVAVCNVPADVATFNAEGTAEQALLLMLAAARRFTSAQGHFAAGPWGAPLGRALMGGRALIVGLGKVGRALAWRLIALGMKVSAVKARPEPGLAAELGLERLAGPDELMELLPRAEFVIAALTATPRTVGLFDAAAFAAMAPGAVFVNVGRGSVVVESALLAALGAGRLAGAGLDVFAREPVQPDNPLLTHPRVVAMPHTGGVTAQSFDQISREVAANIERLKRGEPLRHRAN
ncbi:MAG: hydroxyacid dehydrogenase [Desulfarculus sp.]|nr:MAG: hydroxyacid dehydrogenase [Desulfarculus sp.]